MTDFFPVFFSNFFAFLLFGFVRPKSTGFIPSHSTQAKTDFFHFKPGHRTSYLLHNMGFKKESLQSLLWVRKTDELKAMKQAGFEVGCLLFDLSAAFDLLDADILARALKIYGATETTTAWVRKYLTGWSQMVEYKGHHSKIKDVMVGSPQGSVLSPLLFIIQTSDMPEVITRTE
jgi:hypothetical protein